MKIKTLIIVLAVFLVFKGVSVAFIPEAKTEEVVTDLSKRDVPIEWNFTGTQILLFGAIASPTNKETKPDVVVVVRGPSEDLSARKKQRIAGVWINASSKAYKDVPGYYSISSTRPLSDIASKLTLNQLGIGFDALAHRLAKRNGLLQSDKPDDYTNALLRIFTKEGLYKEEPSGVTIIGKNLIRATISLPANVPIGQFDADIYLFRDGRFLGLNSQRLYIQKQGFERIVYSLAFDYPFLYGVIAVFLAIAAGLIASAAFKRD